MEQGYDKDEDIFNIELEDKPYWKSVELGDEVVLDIARDGSVLSIEILHASTVFSGDLKKVIQMAHISA